MRIVYIAMLCCIIIGTSNSQDRRAQMEERIQSKKIGYITDQLNLTSEEAQVFWPVYNEYQDKMSALKKENQMNIDPQSMTSGQADQFLNSMVSKKERELDIQKEYIVKLKNVIPTEKVAQLYILEGKFREKMVSKIRERMGKRQKKMKERKSKMKNE